VTGDALLSKPIQEASRSFYAVYDMLRPSKAEPQERPQPRQPLAIDDTELIERAKTAVNGAKFTALWEGDASSYPSLSEADFALAVLLAWWTQNDAARVARLLSQSGLWRPKFEEKHASDGRTYAQLTADNACERNREIYDPAPQWEPVTSDPVPAWATRATPQPQPQAQPQRSGRLARPAPATFTPSEYPAAGGVDIAAYRNKQLTAGELAHDLFAEAPLKLSQWFTGDWPTFEGERTCKTHWQAKAQHMTIVSAAPQPWDNWRGFTTRKGIKVDACPHCRHERALDFCRRIERAANDTYAFENQMRYATMSNADAKRMTGRLRKRNQRGEDVAINLTTFPLGANKTIVLHDATDIDGAPLPSDRGALFTLIEAWALATPKGRRAGHGLGTWGRPTRTNDSEEDSHTVKCNDQREQRNPSGQWWIRGVEWGKALQAIEAYSGETLNYTGNELQLDALGVLQALDAKGVAYELVGDVPEVIMSRFAGEDKHTPTKRDTEQGSAPQVWQSPLEIAEDIPGF